MSSANSSIRTSWVAIWILYFSGCTLALHVGKFPAALPLLVVEFNMSLTQTGNLVSIYAVLIAACALLCGMLVARFGYKRFAVIGVFLCLFGSFAGAHASSVSMLMITRVVEGLGWVMGVVSIPVLMSSLAIDRDRPVVMGLWGAFMAVGAGSMLLFAPELQAAGGWRLSWNVAAVLSGVGSIAMLLVCVQQRDALQHLRLEKSMSAGLSGSRSFVSLLLHNANEIRKRKSLAVFMCFLLYSFQYVCVTTYLPMLLMQNSGMPLASASHWTALILLPNAVGNVCAGLLINRGFKHSNILAAAAIMLGVCSLVTFAISDTTTRIVAALLLTGVGGLIPGTLFSTAAFVTSSAAGVGMTIGFMLSGAGVGQLIGPIMFTRIVEWGGHWYAGGLLCFAVGASGAYFAQWLKDIPALSNTRSSN